MCQDQGAAQHPQGNLCPSSTHIQDDFSKPWCNFFPRDIVISLPFKHWIRFSRKYWRHHPWKCSKTKWMWHFEIWLDGHRGVWPRVGLDLGDLFQPQCSGISWSCEITTCSSWAPRPKKGIKYRRAAGCPKGWMQTLKPDVNMVLQLSKISMAPSQQHWKSWWPISLPIPLECVSLL